MRASNRLRVVPSHLVPGRSESSGRGAQISKKERDERTQERREAFDRHHGAAAAAKYRESAEAISEMMRQGSPEKRYVLHPSKNRWLGYWDTVSGLALLYTAVVTPFESSFLDSTVGAAAWLDVWFLTNRLLDIIFTIDMILQFFIAYETRDERGRLFWVEDRNLIVKRYLRSWFVLDAATIAVPGGIDIWTSTMEEADSTSSSSASIEAASKMSFVRALRVLRLVKLVRLVRASRLYGRWKSYVAGNSAIAWIRMGMWACVARPRTPIQTCE